MKVHEDVECSGGEMLVSGRLGLHGNVDFSYKFPKKLGDPKVLNS